MLQRKKWTRYCCYWGVDKLFTMRRSCHQQQNHFLYVIPYYQTEVSGVSSNSWLANQSINLTKWAVLNITIFFNPSSRGEFLNICTENTKKETQCPVKNTFRATSPAQLWGCKTSKCQTVNQPLAASLWAAVKYWHMHCFWQTVTSFCANMIFPSGWKGITLVAH